MLQYANKGFIGFNKSFFYGSSLTTVTACRRKTKYKIKTRGSTNLLKIMKKYLIISFLVIPFLAIHGQNELKSYIEFSFGPSIHGTGDTPGYHYGINYGQQLSKKMYWQFGFEGTLNDTAEIPLFYEQSNGERVDATLHTVTAGFQVVTGIKYNLIQTDSQQFGLSILPLARYQATSLMDINSVLFPGGTGLPIPVRNSIRFSPGRTFTAGASIRLNYNFQFGNNFYLGLLGAAQTDLNSDTITYLGLVLGKKFK